MKFLFRFINLGVTLATVGYLAGLSIFTIRSSGDYLSLNGTSDEVAGWLGMAALFLIAPTLTAILRLILMIMSIFFHKIWFIVLFWCGLEIILFTEIVSNTASFAVSTYLDSSYKDTIGLSSGIIYAFLISINIIITLFAREKTQKT